MLDITVKDTLDISTSSYTHNNCPRIYLEIDIAIWGFFNPPNFQPKTSLCLEHFENIELRLDRISE